VFGGHLHIVLDPPKNIANFDNNGNLVSNTVLVDSGAFAKYVGRLDLIVHMPTAEEAAGGTTAKVTTYTYTLIPIEDTIPADPDLENLLEPYQLQMDIDLNLSQVYAVVPCPPNLTECPKTLRDDPNGGDSQLGNLVATSMRLHQDVEADYAVTNSLGIRDDFQSGPLNLEEMYDVFPFDNTITTVYLSGNETQEMFDDEAADSALDGCRTTSQVSGIAFDNVCIDNDPDCNTYQAAHGLPAGPCAKNIYIGDNCRMPDGTFNGTKCAPLSPLGEYRVAVNDYIANGGSGFAVLQRNTTKFNTGINLRQSLTDYIETLPNRCSPTNYVNISGVNCNDAQGASYDCSITCCCHDSASGPAKCSTSCAAFTQCAAGVLCTDGSGNVSDCTSQCCSHDQASGLEHCSTTSAVFQACVTKGLNPVAQALAPTLYDYSTTACLDATVQAHDGRILAVDNSEVTATAMTAN
jgi:5'-nucleotidase, C-terminal domain